MTDDIDPKLLLKRQVAIVEQIKPLLSGQGALLQGAILADLVAMWLAGHVVVGDVGATDRLRDESLTLFVDTARKLIEPNAKMIGADLLTSKSGKAH